MTDLTIYSLRFYFSPEGPCSLKMHTFGMFISFRMLTLILQLTDTAKQL